MPAVSKQQFKFFEMLKHNPKLRKKKGVSAKVADEYTAGADYHSLPKKISANLRKKGK